jgi:hypothetical protein
MYKAIAELFACLKLGLSIELYWIKLTLLGENLQNSTKELIQVIFFLIYLFLLY